MIRMIRISLATLVAAVVVICVVVALQPADFRVERSITISAPAAVVFARVNDLHRWQEFSPWAKLDPAAKNTFEGPAAGVGAVFAWAGNDDIGAGRMTISESRPDELVRMTIDFLKPFAATNTTDFTFKPQGGQTLVTWSITGKNSFMAKAVSLLINMDKTVGGDFEKGLADLKSLSEAGANH